ncbi:putative ribonuclease H-like domain-containing protein [Tanacetum coccineum]
MDVKSALLYGTIEEEFYVTQPPLFKDPDHPDKVYKVVKALYGLHQAPRACQDKYVAEILKKFNYTDVKSASTLVDLEKPYVKDGDVDDVDVHLYRSMIGSFMYLTASRPDIMDYLFELVAYTDSDYAGATQDRKSTTGGCQFLGNRLISWQCKKKTMVATSTTEAEYVVAASSYLRTKGFNVERHFKRGRDTKIPQSSGPPVKVGDEAVHKELDAQTRFETTSLQSNDPPLSRVNTLGSGEDSLKLIKLMGRSLIEELHLDAGISLVPTHAADQGRIDDTQIIDQLEEQLGVFSAAIALAYAARRRQSVENVQTYTRRRREVSTGSGEVSTASRLVSTTDISTASELDSTTGVKAKEKGKAIMHKSELPNKIKKRVQVQMSVDEELAKKVFEEEQARFNAEQEARFKAEQEQERIDFETALELQKQLDEREEVAAKVDQAHDIDWSDPAVLRYHTLQNRPFSVAEVRKNMCLYLKNQGGYKMSHFKGMSYEDIRPIFERVWDQNQAFIPMGSEIEKEVMKRSGFDLQQESSKPVKEEIVQQDDVIAEQAVKEKSAKKKKLEDDTEKEELQVCLNIVPEEESLNIESLATKQDVLELYSLVKERFQTASPEGYDLLLWGDLKTLIEPNVEDKIWRNQQDWNLINWKLHNFCGVHVLLMDTGFVIYMMVEKKYPLSQDILSKMLSRKLEVDHQSEMGYELIRFVKSQLQQ